MRKTLQPAYAGDVNFGLFAKIRHEDETRRKSTITKRRFVGENCALKTLISTINEQRAVRKRATQNLDSGMQHPYNLNV